MQATGTPMDVAKLGEFRAKWEQLKWRLVDEVDRDFACYNGTKFSHDKFKAYVARNCMSWPSSDSGLLKTDKGLQESVHRSTLKSLRCTS